MIDITANTIRIVIIILPNLLGFSILIIDDVIVKNIRGTITTNIKFRKISPKGLKTQAFSLKIRPIIVPIIMLNNKMMVLL